MSRHASYDDSEKDLIARIKYLGEKSTQTLIFLSFTFVAVVTLKSDHAITIWQQRMLTYAMCSWVGALPFILVGIIPVRDYVERWKNRYDKLDRIRWSKVILLTFAVLLILLGAGFLGAGIWPTESHTPEVSPLNQNE